MPKSKHRAKPAHHGDKENKASGGASGLIVVGGLAIALGLGSFFLFGGGSGGPDAVTVSAAIPELSPVAEKGRVAFNQRCASCHGVDALGGDKGPPLIHQIYEPNHHADYAFVRAVTGGVRAHHWGFGDMPPQPAVEEAQLRQIITFVREVQRANGI